MAKTIVGHLVYQISGESRELEVALEKGKSKTADFTKFIKSAIGIGGAVVAFRALVGVAKDLVKSYSAQEEAEAGLAAAIRATGGDVSNLMVRYKDFASEIQGTTRVGDEVTLNLLRQGKALGITEDRMQEATRGAIGLKQAFGIDMDTALRGIALAYEGNYAQLSRYIPALRTAGTEAEKQIILQKAMADGFDQARAAAKTGTGQLDQLGIEFDDLKEIGGAVLLNFLQPSITALKDFVRGINASLQSTKDYKDFVKGLTEGSEAAAKAQTYAEQQLAKYRSELQKLNLALREEAQMIAGTLPLRGRDIAEVYNSFETHKLMKEELLKKIAAWDGETKAIKENKEELQKQEEAERRRLEREKQAADLLARRAEMAVHLGNNIQFLEERNASLVPEQDAVAAGIQAMTDRWVQMGVVLGTLPQKIPATEMAEKIKQLKQDLYTFFQGMLSGLDNLNQASLSHDLALLDRRRDQELENFEGTQEEKKKLEEQFDKERAQLEYEAALKSWKLQLIGAMADVARAIVASMKIGFPWAIPMVALATVGGALQIAAIHKAKPVPEFAGGADFDVPPGFDNDTFPMLAESGEHVTIEPAGAAPAPIVERPLILSFDGKPFYRGLLQASRNGIALLAERAVVR